jgi:hypothetical protein
MSVAFNFDFDPGASPVGATYKSPEPALSLPKGPRSWISEEEGEPLVPEGDRTCVSVK